MLVLVWTLAAPQYIFFLPFLLWIINRKVRLMLNLRYMLSTLPNYNGLSLSGINYGALLIESAREHAINQTRVKNKLNSLSAAFSRPSCRPKCIKVRRVNFKYYRSNLIWKVKALLPQTNLHYNKQKSLRSPWTRVRCYSTQPSQFQPQFLWNRDM